MAQCYQCGSSVYTTDRFCMECGTEYPARTALAQEAAPSAAPGAATNQPPPAQPLPPARSSAELDEAPTVLDSTGHVQAAASAAKADTASAAKADDTVACPNCASRLPRGARFCGDCGTRLPDASVAVPAPVRPPRAPVALPDPIPPLSASPGPKPTSGPVQAVLPPFRASNRAELPIPSEEKLDKTLPPPMNQQAMPPNGPAAPGWVSPPAPQGAAQPAPWQPGQPAGNSNAGSFQPPGAFPRMPASAAPFQGPFPPQPAPGSASPPQAPFLQAMVAMPPGAAPPSKRDAPRKGYPRGQVITMLIVAFVTMMAALGGLIVLLAQK
jgi:hypothetical protein